MLPSIKRIPQTVTTTKHAKHPTFPKLYICVKGVSTLLVVVIVFGGGGGCGLRSWRRRLNPSAAVPNRAY
jgi:hypothetical protein